MKLLLIEDDPNILSVLQKGFSESGWEVESANDGKDGEYMAIEYNYDMIVLDWMLPNKNGLNIVQTLRSNKKKTPTIMLSAKNEIENKVQVLDAGADDYLSKPFSFQELQARVNALHRRNLSQGLNTIQIGTLQVDIDTKEILENGKKIKLTLKEYELLMFLFKYKNKICSNSMIIDQLWGAKEFIESNVLEVTIYHIKKKIKKKYITSYKGLGYKLEIE